MASDRVSGLDLLLVEWVAARTVAGDNTRLLVAPNGSAEDSARCAARMRRLFKARQAIERFAAALPGNVEDESLPIQVREMWRTAEDIGCSACLFSSASETIHAECSRKFVVAQEAEAALSAYALTLVPERSAGLFRDPLLLEKTLADLDQRRAEREPKRETNAAV